MKIHSSPPSMWKCFLSPILFCFAVQLGAAQGTNYDWTERIQLYGHGFSIPTDFTEDQYEAIADRFKIFTVEKRHAYNSYGGNPSTERATIGTAANIKAINPDAKVLLYWNSVMNYETLYESNAEFGEHPEWVHSIWATGYEIYDLENIDCQDWWVNSVCEIVEAGDLDGVFFDAGPKVNASGLGEAYFTAVNRVRARIGYDKMVVYNGFRVNSPTSIQAGPEYIEHHSGVFVEFFLHAPLDTKEEAALLFDKLTEAYEAGKVIIPRCTPNHVLPGAEDPFLFSFASFLLFYGPNSYYSYSQGGYNVTEGMLDYYPEYYDIATGQSLGGPQRNGWVYTREFENYIITVDLENVSASIEERPEPPVVNIALGGTATQSSTAHSGVASRAVDGDSSGGWSSGTITHTANEGQPYWQLDLGDSYDIDQIVVWGRTDSCCQSRLSDYDVSILNSSLETVWTNYQASYPDPAISLDAGGVSGQYVVVQLRGSGALSLAEVQIFGELSPVDPNVVGNWTFNDGSGPVVADSSGHGNHATVSNATWIQGTDGGALEFDGNSAEVSLPAAAFSGISDEITISLWVNGDLGQPSADTLFRAVDASGNRVLNVHLPWSNGSVYWDAGNDGTSTYDRIHVPASPPQYEGQWNHWVFVKNAISGEMSIYLNGSLFYSATGKTRGMAGIVSATLGSTGGSGWYTGAVDDLIVYDIALTASEVGVLYESY